MNQVRFKRPRRREMTPFRAVFVYGLAFLLVAWHQSGRVAEWFENQALEREGRLSETSLVLAGFLKEKVLPFGPTQLNQWEDKIMAWLTPEAEIGAVRPTADRPGPGRRGEESLETAAPEFADQAAAWLSQVNPDEYSSAPETAPPLPAPTTPHFSKVLLLGDSMMLEGLGPQLQKELRRRHENLTVERDGRYGTGLTRLDYFDWLDFFEKTLVKYSPDLVILTIGANDPQDILDPEGPGGRRRILIGTDEWNELYTARVAGLLKMAEDRDIRVFWVGLPIMGLEPYGSRVAGINALAAATCAGAANCRFWDSWLSVADSQGGFTSYALDENGRRMRLRGRDFIHLTEEGGRIMAQKFLAETEDWADYRAEEEPGVTPMVTPEGPPGASPSKPPAAAAVQPPSEQPKPLTAPLTRLGAPPLPPQATAVPVWPPEPDKAAAEPDLPDSETETPVGLWPEEDEDEFVDPLPVAPLSLEPVSPELVSPELRPAPSAGDGSAEGSTAVWSEGLFYAPALGRETVFRLAEPRAGPGRPGPFPVILLLHGAWDSAAVWERELGRETLLALADRLEVILALPEGGPFSWYLDGPETAVETFLLADFLPEMLKKSAVADPNRLGAAGLSMGGHGALTLALKRPDIFRAAACLSAVTDLATHAGAHKLDPELAIARVLGPAGPEGRNWRPFGAAGLWEARPHAWQGRPLFLGVGAADGLTLTENRAFTRQLTRLGIDHVYQEKPGGHDWGYWSAELPGLLEFLAQAIL